ncbi:hypothetical protein LRX75_06850 [Rhizobium sp. DKSPLA3]|uniref:MYND-type domain-containing protein n=1 Tax=Rhizobium quercicola TaxID=2901226 RepID=A0A9X1NQW4_9HYPH|nr:hypothetical protein [Rhizobium quercicola]MCD7108758.1 hypothetical protein [Rhizobium quercicola]
MVYLAQFSHTKPQSKQILRGERRKSVISKIIDILDDFRLSKFENEGAIRAGVRSALCLSGNGWQPSDSEAAALLSAAFTKMGAKRSSWLEGQREFTEATENCIRCGILLDQDTITARDRFCSDLCRDSARLYREGLEGAINRKVYARSWYVALQKKAPARSCSFCSTEYHSSFAEQKYCSYDCSHAAQRDPARHRECQHCGTGFRQKQLGSRPQRYCSVECRKADWKAEEYSCCICSTSFLAKHKKTKRSCPSEWCSWIS